GRLGARFGARKDAKIARRRRRFERGREDRAGDVDGGSTIRAGRAGLCAVRQDSARAGSVSSLVTESEVKHELSEDNPDWNPGRVSRIQWHVAGRRGDQLV